MTAGGYGRVSAAEKRVMLAAAGEPWPLCDCHGKPRRWKATTRHRAGGQWTCRVGSSEYVRRSNRRKSRKLMERRKNNPLTRLKYREYMRQYMARGAEERDEQRLAQLLERTGQ